MGLFRAILGSKINMTKSVLLGMAVNDVFVSSLADSMGSEVGEWPTTYLGMPLGGNPCSRSFWDPITTRVAKRLDGWKRAFLSKAG